MIFELKFTFFNWMCIKKQQLGDFNVSNFVDYNTSGLVLVCALKIVPIIIPLPGQDHQG